MFDLLIKLIVAATLVQLGFSFSEFENCHSRQCVAKLERKSREVLKVDWKPISVFPEEAGRFK